MAGAYDIAIACGVESMSRVPIGSSMAGKDPLGTQVAARYPEGLVGQGVVAELIAAPVEPRPRIALDEFSARSHELAAAAAAARRLRTEIIPVPAAPTAARRDETIRPAPRSQGLAGLRPAFRTDALAERFPEIDWQITAGNSSPLTDGASAALIMSAGRARRAWGSRRARGSTASPSPAATRCSCSPGSSRPPRRCSPQPASRIDDIDAYEVNEAFASVPLAWLDEVGADPAKLNPRGGAIALGHALGASGTRLLGHAASTTSRPPAAATACRPCARAAAWPTRHDRADLRVHGISGCSALVTGGASGLGLATAKNSGGRARRSSSWTCRAHGGTRHGEGVTFVARRRHRRGAGPGRRGRRSRTGAAADRRELRRRRDRGARRSAGTARSRSPRSSGSCGST